MSSEMGKGSEYDSDERYVVPPTATKGFAGSNRVPGLEAAVDPRDSQVLKTTADVLGGMTPQRLAKLAGVEYVEGEIGTDPLPIGTTKQVSGHVWEISFEKADEPSKTMLLITPSQDVSDVCEAFKQKNLRAIVQSIQHLGRITGRAEITGIESKKPQAIRTAASALTEIRDLGIDPRTIYKELSCERYDIVKSRHFQIPSTVFEAAFDRNIFGVINVANAAREAQLALNGFIRDVELELKNSQMHQSDSTVNMLASVLADSIEDQNRTTIARITDSVYQSADRERTAKLAHECHAKQFDIPEETFVRAVLALVRARDAAVAINTLGAIEQC